MGKMFPWLQIFICGRIMVKTLQGKLLDCWEVSEFFNKYSLNRNGLSTCYVQSFELSALGDRKKLCCVVSTPEEFILATERQGTQSSD